MAASLTRSDPSSPASVAEAGFSTTRRGYNQDEVRAFLSSVASELGRLQERQRQLEAELHTARSATTVSVELDDETIASRLGEETLRVLQTARESASEIKIRAEDNAARILSEANDEANRIRQETEVEAAWRRYDSSADAEAEVALAKQQGREMVNEARAYRERVLADLDRRTTLARRQIEELLQGRDRLLQVFERARLVAVDVTSDLRAIEGPDELVNLAHTTGPVPLMVPTDRAPADETPNAAVTTDSEATELSDGSDVDSSAGVDAELSDGSDVDSSAGVDAELSDGSDVDSSAGVDAELSDGSDVDSSAGVDAELSDGSDVDSPTELGDIVDAALDADAVEDVAAVDEPVAAARDANVVSLFRGRVANNADLDADRDAGEQDGDAPSAGEDFEDRPDVGGIFARLRSEVPETEQIEEAADGASAGAVTEGVPDAGTASGDESDDVDPVVEPTPFTRRDEAIVPLIVSGARKIKRTLADEQNGILDALRRDEPVRSLDDLLPAIGEQLDVYVGALADELIGAAAAGATELGLNDTKTLRRKLAKTGALDTAHDLLRTDLLRPLRDRLERAISDGAGDNEDITKRVRAVYREWKTQHIDDQLDDVFRFAHGGGLAVSIEPGTQITWAIDPGHPACPDCEDNSLAGSVAAGEAFPTGHTAAPAHPGCRCLTVPAPL